MNIKEFFEICEDFLNQINPNIYDDEDEKECFFDLCYMMRNTLLLINPRIKSN